MTGVASPFANAALTHYLYWAAGLRVTHHDRRGKRPAARPRHAVQRFDARVGPAPPRYARDKAPRLLARQRALARRTARRIC
jgi:hypothetical protein